MTTKHGFSTEPGSNPATYTCRCGFRSADYGEVSAHLANEEARAHAPRRLTTIPAVEGQPAAEGIEIASTPYSDARNAVEVRLTIHEGGGSYRRHMLLASRTLIPFLIGELVAHRLDQSEDACAACAAQALAARVTDDARHSKHTCPEPLSSGAR